MGVQVAEGIQVADQLALKWGDYPTIWVGPCKNKRSSMWKENGPRPERCDVRKTQPAIAGSGDGGRATSQGTWVSSKPEKARGWIPP